MFELEFASQAAKFLRKADKELAQILFKRCELLQVDPFPSDVKRIANRKEKIFRIRLGNYRIQYTVAYERNTIFITDIDKRERAY
jgi:mRNA interferase RelE/StbE